MRPQTEDRQKRIIALREKGLSIDAIALEVGLTKSRVSQLLPIELRGQRVHHKTPPDLIERINALKSEGKSGNEIAQAVGYSKSQVSKLLNGEDHVPYRRATKDEKADAVARYQNGETFKSLAESFNRSESTIVQWIRESGAIGNRSPNYTYMQKHQTVLNMWREGIGIVEICRETQTSFVTVRNWVKSVKGGPGEKTTRDAAIAVEQYQQGATVQTISRELSRSPETVSKWLKDAGVSVLNGVERMTLEQIREASRKGVEARKNNPKIFYRECSLEGCDITFKLSYENDRTMFCSREHAGLSRRNPSSRTLVKCKSTNCPKPEEMIETWSHNPKHYHNRECFTRSNKTVVTGDDSNWEPAFLTLCALRGPIKAWRFDNKDKIGFTRMDGKPGLYGPDIVLSWNSQFWYVDTKGYIRPNKVQEAQWKWKSWREQKGNLAIVFAADMDALMRMDKLEIQAYIEKLTKRPVEAVV